jgi:hypothetical protein
MKLSFVIISPKTRALSSKFEGLNFLELLDELIFMGHVITPGLESRE